MSMANVAQQLTEFIFTTGQNVRELFPPFLYIYDVLMTFGLWTERMGAVNKREYTVYMLEGLIKANCVDESIHLL
jgi:hypothetical protein